MLATLLIILKKYRPNSFEWKPVFSLVYFLFHQRFENKCEIAVINNNIHYIRCLWQCYAFSQINENACGITLNPYSKNSAFQVQFYQLSFSIERKEVVLHVNQTQLCYRILHHLHLNNSWLWTVIANPTLPPCKTLQKLSKIWLSISILFFERVFKNILLFTSELIK